MTRENFYNSTYTKAYIKEVLTKGYAIDHIYMMESDTVEASLIVLIGTDLNDEKLHEHLSATIPLDIQLSEDCIILAVVSKWKEDDLAINCDFILEDFKNGNL